MKAKVALSIVIGIFIWLGLGAFIYALAEAATDQPQFFAVGCLIAIWVLLPMAVYAIVRDV